MRFPIPVNGLIARVAETALGLVLLLGAAAASSLSYAQATDWDKVLLAGRKEAKIVLYTSMVPAQNERIRADFEKAHPGFSLEMIRFPGGAGNTKVEQERTIGAEGADVFIHTDLQWALKAGQASWFNALPAGPSRKAWPEKYLLPGGSVALGITPFLIAYNTNLSKNPIESYQDLLKPEYKGKISVQSLIGGVTAISWYAWLEDTQGPDFLKRLAAQQPMVSTAVPSTQSVASGELVATALTVPSIIAPLVSQGAPVKGVVPRPALGTMYYVAALSSSKRPNAALVLLDYLMSRRGQAMVVGQQEMASPLPEVVGSLDSSVMSVPDVTKWTPEAMNAYTQKWNAIFVPK